MGVVNPYIGVKHQVLSPFSRGASYFCTKEKTVWASPQVLYMM